MKNLVDDIVVTGDKIVDMAESAVISPSNKIRLWLVDIVLLSFAFLLLLVAVFGKYCVKRKLIFPCLLLYMN